MQAGEIIRAKRKATGLTQPEAAEHCGVSFSALEKWERGAPIAPPMLCGLLLMLGATKAEALAAAETAKEVRE